MIECAYPSLRHVAVGGGHETHGQVGHVGGGVVVRAAVVDVGAAELPVAIVVAVAVGSVVTVGSAVVPVGSAVVVVVVSAESVVPSDVDGFGSVGPVLVPSGVGVGSMPLTSVVDGGELTSVLSVLVVGPSVGSGGVERAELPPSVSPLVAVLVSSAVTEVPTSIFVVSVGASVGSVVMIVVTLLSSASVVVPLAPLSVVVGAASSVVVLLVLTSAVVVVDVVSSMNSPGVVKVG